MSQSQKQIPLLPGDGQPGSSGGGEVGGDVFREARGQPSRRAVGRGDVFVLHSEMGSGCSALSRGVMRAAINS